MSKKENNNTINFVPESIQEQNKVVGNNGAAPFLESEAYAKPHFDESIETTILKVVGSGGPVPIVAPKHNTIQLQPIIVPLAVVPYMTQDSGVLRTDGRTASFASESDYQEPTTFERFDNKTKIDNRTQKKQKIGSTSLKSRMFAIVILLLSAYTVVPFILAKFYPVVSEHYLLFDLNIIDTITNWANGVPPTFMAVQILHIIGACFAAITVLTSLVSLAVGKFPKTFACILTFFTSIPLLSVLIYQVVKKTFVVEFEIAFTSIVTVSLLAFILSIIFAISLNHDQDKIEAFGNNLI